MTTITDDTAPPLNPIYVRRKRFDIVIRGLCVGAALFGVTWLALILFTLFYNGLAGINLAVFTQDLSLIHI